MSLSFYLPHGQRFKVVDNIAVQGYGRTLGFILNVIQMFGCEDLKLSHQEIAGAKHPREVVSRLQKDGTTWNG
jgi:hypothetical protein